MVQKCHVKLTFRYLGSMNVMKIYHANVYSGTSKICHHAREDTFTLVCVSGAGCIMHLMQCIDAVFPAAKIVQLFSVKFLRVAACVVIVSLCPANINAAVVVSVVPRNCECRCSRVLQGVSKFVSVVSHNNILPFILMHVQLIHWKLLHYLVVVIVRNVTMHSLNFLHRLQYAVISIIVKHSNSH